MNQKVVKNCFSVVVIVIGFAAVFGIGSFLDERRPGLPKGYIDKDLSLQGDKLKGFALGFEGLLADWYWIQAMQYIGHKIMTSQEERINIENLRPLTPRLLYPLLNNVTTLDPRFMAAYSYGATILPTINRKHAIDIVEKGIENNPDTWRLYHHLGFIYWKLEDYEKAAEIYKKGSQIEGAPSWMKTMAAKMTSDGGKREVAREIYTQMYNEAQETQTKESARIRLLELDSFDERDAINTALENFKVNNQRCAKDLREIIPILQTVQLPNELEFRVDQTGNIVDPTDTPYLLDKRNCKVLLDSESTKLPLM